MMIKLFFSRTHFLSFSFNSVVYRVLEAFVLNATLIFTFNNNNNMIHDDLNTNGSQHMCKNLHLFNFRILLFWQFLVSRIC